MTDTLGSRLRAIRRGEGLSQNRLAGLSGIPKSRLSRYENGHLLPSIPTLERLAQALRVPESALLGDPRASYHAFAAALEQAGVDFESVEEAQDLAHRFTRYLRAGESGAAS